MMVQLGNFLFRNRNGLFPVFYAILLVPSWQLFANPVIAMIIGFSITIAGQLIRIVTIGLVYIIRGGRDRRVYAETLVTGGIFSHCRNPLYAGNILILTGLGIASNSLLFITVFTPLFLFFYQAIVIAEENYLRNKFGEKYDKYCRKVNRWLPDLSGIGTTISSMEFKWKRVIVREYNSTYIWTTGAVLIVMKHFYFNNDLFNFNASLPLFITILSSLLCLYLLARYLKKSQTLVSD
ncbi:MAG TPA: isoprenylcysteine carboxylmethyltransferase family protein [Chitinophagaceae bacterium]|nr:isoprenylcysteine carboxylmethyltransferase family protein [Chitinophagaceae bacterium]